MLLRRHFVYLLGCAALPSACADQTKLLHEEHSSYAHIRVREDGSVRTLCFVDQSGREIVETRVDLAEPHRLLSPYTRFMFVGHLVLPRPQRVLLVGLGGGAMVHVLARLRPSPMLDVVEIDPAVIRLARDYFGVSASPSLVLHAEDVYAFVQREHQPYDFILMDAFLPPSVGTDPGGTPLRIKTQAFYERLRSLLAPSGVVAFNAMNHASFDDDLMAIRSLFPHTMVFAVPGTRNRVVLGRVEPFPTAPKLIAMADRFDESAQLGFRLRALLSAWTEAPPELEYTTWTRITQWFAS